MWRGFASLALILHIVPTAGANLRTCGSEVCLYGQFCNITLRTCLSCKADDCAFSQSLDLPDHCLKLCDRGAWGRIDDRHAPLLKWKTRLVFATLCVFAILVIMFIVCKVLCPRLEAKYNVVSTDDNIQIVYHEEIPENGAQAGGECIVKAEGKTGHKKHMQPKDRTFMSRRLHATDTSIQGDIRWPPNGDGQVELHL